MINILLMYKTKISNITLRMNNYLNYLKCFKL